MWKPRINRWRGLWKVKHESYGEAVRAGNDGGVKIRIAALMVAERWCTRQNVKGCV